MIKYLLTAFLMVGLLSGTAFADRSNYPASWFVEVPRDQAASWEILPQDAAPGVVILSKRTELGILSNFASTPFVLDGERFEAVEGFWQMMKFPESVEDPRAQVTGVNWPYTREQVSKMIAFEAKAAGDFGSDVMKKMGINWVTYLGKKLEYRGLQKGDHYNLIVRAMRAKLEANPEVKRILLQTGDLVLVPDHHQDPNASPAWKYHQIWMNIRTQISNKKS